MAARSITNYSFECLGFNCEETIRSHTQEPGWSSFIDLWSSSHISKRRRGPWIESAAVFRSSCSFGGGGGFIVWRGGNTGEPGSFGQGWFNLGQAGYDPTSTRGQSIHTVHIPPPPATFFPRISPARGFKQCTNHRPRVQPIDQGKFKNLCI